MANKVLSIKMDEKDIERLRKYYEVLVSSGFLSGKTMSLNAFYKHLLLDYLEDDVSRAFATYSAYGITPRCINPESMDDNENFKLNNTQASQVALLSHACSLLLQGPYISYCHTAHISFFATLAKG